MLRTAVVIEGLVSLALLVLLPTAAVGQSAASGIAG